MMGRLLHLLTDAPSRVLAWQREIQRASAVTSRADHFGSLVLWHHVH